MKNLFGDGSSSASKAILSEVAPILSTPKQDRAAAAQALLDEGWEVGIVLKLEGGVQRTVYVEQKTAMTMSFPIVEGEHEPLTHPSTDQVVEACQRIISDGLLEAWDIVKSSADSCSWVEEPCDDVSGWKVQWHELDQPPAHST